jgi:CheY-like chemotaxis protein
MNRPGEPAARIFVAEDEALLRLMLEDMLLDLGFVVSGQAQTIEEALQLAKDIECDLALLDVNLNGATTYPVAEILFRRRVPLLFATGYGRLKLPPPLDHAVFLQKPFTKTALSSAIAQALRTC